MQKTLAASPILPLASLVAVAFLLPSCSDDSQKTVSGSSSGAASLVTPYEPVPRKTASVDADAGKLIAADAVAVARVRKIGDVIQKVKAIAESFQPGAGSFVNVEQLLVMAGLRPKDVDMTGSPLVSLSMTQMGPMPLFIVPATDAKDAADITPLESAVSGKYLGLSMGAKPVVGASTPTIAASLPAADYTVRLNLKALLAQFKPKIEQYLDPKTLAGMNPDIKGDSSSLAMLGAMAKGAKEMLDTAEQLDVAVSLDGGALDLEFALDLGGGGTAAPSGHAVSLARMLPITDASMYMFLDADWSELMNGFMPMYDTMAASMPAEQGKAFRELMRSSMDLYKGMKGGAGFAFDITANGIQGVGLMESEDPAGCIEQYLSFMRDYPDFISAFAGQAAQGVDFVTVSPATKSTVDGVEFHTLALKKDMATAMKLNPNAAIPEEQLAAISDAMEGLLGKGGMHFGMGAHENLVLLAIGDVESHAASLVTAVKKGRRHQSAVVEHAAARLHARPSCFVGADFRRVLQQIMPVIRKVAPVPIPEVPAGDPVIMWMSAAATKRGYELQAHIDLVGIAGIVKAMKPR